jgi:tol-pal system protein YbgF
VTLSAATWRKRSRLGYAFSAGLLALSFAAASSFAQETPPQAGQGAAPAPAAAPSAKPQGSDSVGARLTRIEEKLGDLQVLVGALESFVRSKPGAMLPQETAGGAASPQAQSGDLSPRVDALETQIGALTSQLEQMSQQLSALKAEPAAQAPASLPPSNPPPARQGQADPSSPSALADMAGTAGDASDTSKPRWYGPKPGEDQVSALPGGEAHPLLPPAQEGAAPGGWPQSLMAALPDSDVHSLYERGYGALSQRDYAGAEAAFRQLIESYPKDPLAGNAQYWIGESFYRRGQYKNAADAFLKGYKKYKSGDKAPETLLKLGMSLAALGQKDAACSTFGELKSKYPAAPEPVRDEAKAEQKKARC